MLLRQLTPTPASPNPICPDAIGMGQVAVRRNNGSFYEVVAVGVETYINKRLYSIFIQAIVKAHPNAARLSEDLLDNVAANVITSVLCGIGFLVSFDEFMRELVTDFFPNSSVIFLGS